MTGDINGEYEEANQAGGSLAGPDGRDRGAAKAELVANGGFETGDLTGWTLTGDPLFTEVKHFAAHDGSWGLSSGAVATPADLTQDLATTAGESYTFSFWLRLFADGTPNSFEADWDGSALVQFTDSPAFDWTHYSFTVMATSRARQSSFFSGAFLRNGTWIPSVWIGRERGPRALDLPLERRVRPGGTVLRMPVLNLTTPDVDPKSVGGRDSECP